MKINITIDIAKQGQTARFYDQKSIYMRFSYCTHEEFGEWCNNNAERLQRICNKWSWTYDIGHSDKVIYITKD